MKKILIALPVLIVAAAFFAHRSAAPTNRIPDGAAHALDASEKMVLYSLEPGREIGADGNYVVKEESFHGFDILGKMDLSDAQVAKAGAALRGIVTPGGGTPDCFTPRYGLRTQSERHTYDFVVAPECNSLNLYRDDEHLTDLHTSGDLHDFDAMLAAASIRLEKSTK